MLFPTEDQSKLDKRSLINLPIPLGWEQICSCFLPLSKRGSWCIDVVWLVERPPTSQMQGRDQNPGVLAAAMPSVTPTPTPCPECCFRKKENISLGKQSALLALRKRRGENCKGYTHSAASALFNFLLRMLGCRSSSAETLPVGSWVCH